jgi:N-acetyltransferase 10
MLQALEHPDVPDASWLAPFSSDFKSRFISLLGGAFKTLSPALALSILNPKLSFSEAEASAGVQAGVLVTRGDGRALSPYDLKRLQVGGCRAWPAVCVCKCCACVCGWPEPASHRHSRLQP